MTRNEAAQILGISPSANEDELKKAFRKKAMQLHPDHNKSANARSLFIEVHEAYEYLTDLASRPINDACTHKYNSARNSKSSKFRSPNHKHRQYSDPYRNMSREEFEARYKRARKAAEENQNKESDAIHAKAFKEYQTTWRRTFAKYMAVIGLILSILFTIDFFMGTIKEDIPANEAEILKINDTQYTYYYLNIHHVKYSLPNKIRFLINNQKVEYTIERTRLFQDIIAISIHNKQHFIELKPSYSSYGTFPLIPLIMLIPLLSFWFEKPSFNFVFFAVYFNIYVFPIITIVLLFHDGRLIRLFGL